MICRSVKAQIKFKIPVIHDVKHRHQLTVSWYPCKVQMSCYASVRYKKSSASSAHCLNIWHANDLNSIFWLILAVDWKHFTRWNTPIFQGQPCLHHHHRNPNCCTCHVRYRLPQGPNPSLPSGMRDSMRCHQVRCAPWLIGIAASPLLVGQSMS